MHLGPSRGIVRGLPADDRIERLRVPPPAVLAQHVHHFWFVRWALATPRVAEVLGYPSAQIVFEERAGARRADVGGPRTGRLTACLAGEGRKFGITFRPAAFAPLLGTAMTQLTDRVVPLGDVLAAGADAWVDAVLGAPDMDRRIALATEFLVPLLPALPAEVRGIRDLVERMATDRTMLRVDDACDAIGLDRRALQRRFRRFVGVNPKWVIRRFRLHEAIERLRAPDGPPLAALASSLGYADQAHFARDFARVVGHTPKRFALGEGPATDEHRR